MYLSNITSGNYPWNRANPVPVIPNLWKSTPSPAKAIPDPIPPQQSCASASSGIPKLTMAQIVSRSIAGIPPDVYARGPIVANRDSVRATPAPVDNYSARPIPTGGVPIPTGGVPIPTGGVPIPTGGVPVGPPRPAHPPPPHPGTVRFSPALADLTRTVLPPPPEERNFHESWASNLVSPAAPQPNPLHSGPTGLPANQLAIVTRNVIPQAPPRIPVRGQCHHFLVVTNNNDIEALDVLIEIKVCDMILAYARCVIETNTLGQSQRYLTVIGPFLTELNTQAGFHIGFGEIFEARHAIQWFNKYDWEVIPMSITDFNDATRFAFATPSDLNDTVYARVYCGPQSAIDAESVERVVRPILSLVGEVTGLMRLDIGQPDDPSIVRYYELAVVYSNIGNALNAIRALNGVRTTVCTGMND